ncbi:MAG: Hsp20/alpha crystallin family protein [Bacteroidetes bacterium]|jgi:HSP20 family protein|nr:Hsp20/alpha crystallin family protein [Bacteroidota bacterium]
MTLTKFKPRTSLFSNNFYPSAFDNIFSDLMRDTNRPLEGFVTPSAEVIESDKDFKINLMFAGFDKKDIKIDMQENELTVTAEKVEKNTEENEKYHLSEFRSGKYKRSFHLPENVSADKIEAELKNGILGLVIPKKAKAKLKAISIK